LASFLIKVTTYLELINIDLINLYIISTLCRKNQIEPQIIVQTNQANFSGSKLKAILVPLPPNIAQNRIVDKVDELFAVYDALKEQIVDGEGLKLKMAEAVEIFTQ
jgi:type I restriction enzyme, S subunit